MDTIQRVVRAYPTRLPRVLYDRIAIDQRARRGDLLTDATVATCLGRLKLSAPGDLGQLREVAVANAYALTGFIPRRGWTVVDAGANLGCFSRWAMRTMHEGTIVAIEPVPAICALLRYNVGPLAPRSCRGVVVHCLERAVARDTQPLELLVPAGQSGWTRAARSPDATESGFEFAPQDLTRIVVPAAPLDALVRDAVGEQPVDLLKVDIEGMEAECFASGPRVLSHARRVVFEYHSQAQRAACTGILQSHGLRECHHRPNPFNREVGVTFFTRSDPSVGA